jgi:hypothetical protein
VLAVFCYSQVPTRMFWITNIFPPSITPGHSVLSLRLLPKDNIPYLITPRPYV